MLRTCCHYFWIALAAFACAQQPPASNDLARVAQAGFIDRGQYVNPVLQLTIDVPDAQATIDPAKGEKLVRLVQIAAAPSVSDKFAFTLLADTLSSYPDLKSPQSYLRSVVHQFEQQGFSIIAEDIPRTIDDVSLVGTIMQTPDLQKGKSKCCYRGLYSGFRSLYILTFAVEAGSEARIDDLLTKRVHFGTTGASLPPPAQALKAGVGGITPPRVVSNPQPQYPKSGRNGFKTGTVVIRAVVGTDGTLRNARVVRSLGPGFDAKALEAVKQWTFQPAKKDGDKVAVQIDIEVSFRLSD